MTTEPWWVYIIHSPSTAKVYIGIALDPFKRLAKHNAGGGAKYTRGGNPWMLGWAHKCPNKSAALQLEYKLKQLPRKKKLELAGLV